MSDLRVLTVPMMEEKTHAGWDKATIDYLQQNELRIKKYVASMLNQLRASDKVDLEDFMSELYMTLYRNADYDIERAISTKNGEIIPIEGYVQSVAKYLTKKVVTTAFKYEGKLLRDMKKGDDDFSPFDTLYDENTQESMEQIEYDLQSICEMCEPHRNKYGLDMFMLFYVRLALNNIEGSDEKYALALNSLGIDKKELNDFKENTRKDDTVVSIAKAINKYGEESLSVLEKFVYGVDRVKKVLASL